jgi:hypothetical protein
MYHFALFRLPMCNATNCSNFIFPFILCGDGLCKSFPIPSLGCGGGLFFGLGCFCTCVGMRRVVFCPMLFMGLCWVGWDEDGAKHRKIIRHSSSKIGPIKAALTFLCSGFFFVCCNLCAGYSCSCCSSAKGFLRFILAYIFRQSFDRKHDLVDDDDRKKFFVHHQPIRG